MRNINTHRQIDNVLWNISDVANRRSNNGNLINVAAPLKVDLLSGSSDIVSVTGSCDSGDQCLNIFISLYSG